MLSQHIKKILETQLGKKIASKIKQELHLWYQIDLDDAVTQFEKLDRVLTEIYGKSSAKSLEKRFLKLIIDANSIKNRSYQYQTITVTEPQLVQTVLTVIEDESFRKIFRVMTKGDLSFEKILEISDIGLTRASAYRKMESLVKTGLIMETGYIMGDNGRKVKTYKKTFDGIDIRLNRGAVSLMMTINNETFQDSVILNTVFASS